MLLKTYEIAYRLARKRGKKLNDRFDKEFNRLSGINPLPLGRGVVHKN